MAGSVVFPFLKIGKMFALLQSSGRMPESRDCWKMKAKIGAISSAAIFRAWFILVRDFVWSNCLGDINAIE